jgi:flagellar basal body-associated protein FliL
MRKQAFYIIMIIITIFMAVISYASVPRWNLKSTTIINNHDSIVTYKTVYENKSTDNDTVITVVFQLPLGINPVNGLPDHKFSAVYVKFTVQGVVTIYRKKFNDRYRIISFRKMSVDDLKLLMN